MPLMYSKKKKKGEKSTLINEIRKLEKSEYIKKKLIDKLIELENQVQEIDATYETKEKKLKHLKENHGCIEQEHDRAKTDVEQKQIEQNKLRQKLNDLKNQSNDDLAVYSQNMLRLLKRIDEENRNGRFKKTTNWSFRPLHKS